MVLKFPGFGYKYLNLEVREGLLTIPQNKSGMITPQCSSKKGMSLINSLAGNCFRSSSQHRTRTGLCSNAWISEPSLGLDLGKKASRETIGPSAFARSCNDFWPWDAAAFASLRS